MLCEGKVCCFVRKVPKKKQWENKSLRQQPPEYSERDNLLQDTHDLIRDATEILEEDQRQKQKQDRKRADKNRKHSLETMVETREREGPPHKRKSQKKDDMSYSHEGIIPQWKKENSS